MPEETAPEDTKESDKPTNREIMKPITFQEVRDFASEMKDGVLNLLDDQAKEVLTMGARRGSLAIRKSLGGFMSGLTGEEDPAAPCKVVKKDGTVCGRAPCRYHGGN